MKKLYPILLTAVAALAAPAAADAAPNTHFDLAGHALKARTHTSPFDSERIRQINALQARMDKGQRPRFAAESLYEPSVVNQNVATFGDLDGPDGNLWYYTASYEKDIVKYEYWTDVRVVGYKFDIFNADMEYVGSVQDKIDFREDEVRAVGHDIAPIVTQHFFNTDDNYEIMVGLIVNTTYYVNQYRTVVYSIGGEKEGDDDKIVLTIESQLGDVLQAGSKGDENVLMTFMNDGNSYVPEDENDDLGNLDRNYWEKYLGNYVEYNIYAKAKDNSGPRMVYDRRIRLAEMGGDQQDSPTVMSFEHQGKARYMFNYYEQPFYNRYDSYMDDMTQREDNNAVFEILEFDGDENFNTVQTTKIAAQKSPAENILFSYYAVGMLRYRQDIDYNMGSAGQAAFFITKLDYTPNNDGYLHSYYVYNPDGSLKYTIFENSDGNVALSDLPGQNPMQIFVSLDAQGNYVFNFVDLYKGENELAMSWLVPVEGSDDPEKLTSNIDRIPDGDSFKYVGELRVPVLDENDNDIIRAMEIDRKGNVERIDEVNMGTAVNYAQLYISAETLDPKFFHSDDTPEYMLLIKRGRGDAGSDEELMVAQVRNIDNPDGKTLLLCGPHDDYGVLSTIMPYTDETGSRLLVSYVKTNEYDERIYTQTFYDLPLDQPSHNSSIDIIAPAESAIAFDGAVASLEGASLEVYNLQGMLVAKGQDSVSLAHLGAGSYIVRSADEAIKVSIR